MSRFKDFFTAAVYALAEQFNSYVAVYILVAAILSILGFFVSLLNGRLERVCSKITPYVTAAQKSDLPPERKDKLLAQLYNDNHYNALPVYIIKYSFIILSLIIYPSLYMVTSEGHDIPVEFLFIEDVTAKTFSIYFVLFYSVIQCLSRIVISASAKNLNASELKLDLVFFVSYFVSMLVCSRLFSVLIIIYLSARCVITTIIRVIYNIFRKPAPEIIISNELKEIYELERSKAAAEEGENGESND